VNHDQALIATFTASLALMMFVMRSRPAARQGLWLGGAVAAALLVKGTALVLLPLGAMAYTAQALCNRDSLRTVLRSAGLALGVIAVLAGWWYVRSLALYGTVTGYTSSPVPPNPNSTPLTLSHAWDLARQWTGITYRTYWFHHFNYEAPRAAPQFFVPLFLGVLGMLGLGTMAVRMRRRLMSPEEPLLRQCIVLVAAVMAVYLPVMWTDIQRNSHGGGFFLTGGRYLLPAYGAVAVLFVVGLRELIARRAQPIALSGLAVFAAWFCWRTWTVNYAWRYYGDKYPNRPLGQPRDGWHELFRRMSFDRPEFITPTTLTIAMILMVLSLLAAAVAVAYGSYGDGGRLLAVLRRPRALSRPAAGQGGTG
jgi:hypothetical protein